MHDKPVTAPRCFYFGCWNRPGHYLHEPGGMSARDDRIAYYRPGRHLDGTLAPRRGRSGGLCWVDQVPPERNEREWEIRYSGEYPQGQFLRHVLPNGFTAIQWWDRCQGDERGACNSTILLEGERTSAECLAALAEHFPHVLENLKRHGVELVEVTL